MKPMVYCNALPQCRPALHHQGRWSQPALPDPLLSTHGARAILVGLGTSLTQVRLGRPAELCQSLASATISAGPSAPPVTPAGSSPADGQGVAVGKNLNSYKVLLLADRTSDRVPRARICLEDRIMIRLPPLALLATALLALAAPAPAQTPAAIPDITAEVWPHPIGDYLPLRIIITNSINAYSYTDGDRVHGGALKVDYRISCTGENCPAPTLRTGTTTIPCGQQEGGVLHYRIAHLKDRGPLTLRLHITKITFQAWEQDLIDRINDRHRPWPNDDLACPTGNYSSTTVTSGPNWMSPPAMVR